MLEPSRGLSEQVPSAMASAMVPSALVSAIDLALDYLSGFSVVSSAPLVEGVADQAMVQPLDYLSGYSVASSAPSVEGVADQAMVQALRQVEVEVSGQRVQEERAAWPRSGGVNERTGGSQDDDCDDGVFLSRWMSDWIMR